MLLIVPWAFIRSSEGRPLTGHPMRSKSAESIREPLIIGHDHPAFPRGDVLHWVKAKGGHLRVQASADRSPFFQSPHRVGRVLDYADLMALRDSLDPLHVDRVSR